MASSGKNKRNLIMCATPLQMLIAKKIIDLFPNEEFDLLVVALNNNKKYQYYYTNLKKSCVKTLYYIPRKGIFSFFDYIYHLKINKFKFDYSKYFLASIDSRHFQYILSHTTNPSIYTFDDGTANINYNSIFYKHLPISKIKKILWKLFGVKYYIEDIKLLSILHYTLYEDFPNIVKNIKYIKLYSNSGNNNNNIKKSIKIYLGQPLNEVLPEFNSNMLVTCLNSLNIDYYFPHPREKYNLNLKEIKYIKTSLIFEDYIINYLKQNPDTQVEIFSFISTAILNVKDLERVKVYYIYNREALKEFKDFYSFISKNFSVKILNINDEGV